MAKTAMVGASVILLAGLFFAPVTQAEPQNVKVRAAGSAVETEIDVNGDTFTADLATFESKGSLGQSRVKCVTEWEPTAEPDVCPPGFLASRLVLVPFPPNFLGIRQQSCVATYADQSQLIWAATGEEGRESFLCFNPLAGQGFGEINADYFGGTGRFANAVGQQRSTFTFAGIMFEVGFSVVTVETEGTIDLNPSP